MIKKLLISLIFFFSSILFGQNQLELKINPSNNLDSLNIDFNYKLSSIPIAFQFDLTSSKEIVLSGYTVNNECFNDHQTIITQIDGYTIRTISFSMSNSPMISNECNPINFIIKPAVVGEYNFSIINYTFADSDSEINIDSIKGASINIDNTTGQIENIQSEVESIIYPNPFNSNTNLVYSLSKPQNTIISVFDLLGREIFSKTENSTQGINTSKINFNNQPSGTYIVLINNDEKKILQKVILIK